MIELPASLTDFFASSSVALALASSEGDQPLQLANEKFYTLTHYSSDEVLGRNCRFLQERPNGERAPNQDARKQIIEFLGTPTLNSVRTPLINFRKDGRPFVNLLYMSKLSFRSKRQHFIFASQFDVSRTRPEMISEYDKGLAAAARALSPVIEESGIFVETTLNTIANSAAQIAQAKLMITELETSGFE